MPPKVNITLNIGTGFACQSANSDEVGPRRAAIISRFWSHVNRAEAEACWSYCGYVSDRGYGVFGYTSGGRSVRVRAHRLAWELSRGEIPDGLSVLHRCDNPRCVNPSHLFLGSQKDNMHDAVRKGRKRAWGLQKLNAEQVHEIRRRCRRGERQRDVGRAFGVARNTVSQIVNRKTWAHLPESVHSDSLRERESTR